MTAANLYWPLSALGIILLFFVIESYGSSGAQFRARNRGKEDLFYYLLNYLVVVPALTVPVTWMVTSWLVNTSHVQTRIIKINFWADFLLAFLLTDFIYYWLHRILHTKYFWRFHQAHHEPERYGTLIAARLHPVNFFIISLRYISLVFFNLSPFATTALHFTSFTWGQFSHMDKRWHMGPLRYILISPVAHRWHHEKEINISNNNFGITFSIWDRLFGTMYESNSAFPENPGVANARPKPVWREILDPISPFHRSAE